MANKPEMIPITVIDMLITPVKENIIATVDAVEKLSASVDNLSDVVVGKITDLGKERDRQYNEHEKTSVQRTDDIKNVIFTRDNANKEALQVRYKELDEKIVIDRQLFNDLKKSNECFDEMADRVELSLKDVQEKIKTMIIVVVVGFAIFLSVYGIATYMAKSSVKASVDAAVQEIIHTRGPTNQTGVSAYWTDDKGIKRYILVEPGEVDATKKIPSK